MFITKFAIDLHSSVLPTVTVVVVVVATAAVLCFIVISKVRIEVMKLVSTNIDISKHMSLQSRPPRYFSIDICMIKDI